MGFSLPNNGLGSWFKGVETTCCLQGYYNQQQTAEQLAYAEAQTAADYAHAYKQGEGALPTATRSNLKGYLVQRGLWGFWRSVIITQ